MTNLERLLKRDDNSGGMILSEAEAAAIKAAITVIESVEIDTTCGNTGDENAASYYLVGNVEAGALRELGFDAPEASLRRS